ncbi:MFS transporter [Massilia sp. GCM10020059]|uniref:MFS transporter n=1 Tax=Massilia agrisoli TaxID=2892444 RepID=A0ABS8IY88_9BURK|nr:MFS transporter [Massilia agrisoli]MCC6072866.1 MFS transporter [Massilia agrisoli]
MTQSDRSTLLREPNFRWMMGGSLISALGDQFTMVALPWLVLTMTGDALTLGLVIALMSVPRALFMLVGGALVDRYSPKSVLMLSKYANAVLLAALTALVLSGQPSLPAVCALALGLGLASAFSIPSGTSLLPHVVAPGLVPRANGMLMGVRQVTMLSGPLLAALVFALFGDGSGAGDNSKGMAIAFGFDAFTFLFTAWTLSKVQAHHAPPRAIAAPVLRAIGDGLAMVWRDTTLRRCMLYWAICAFVVGGLMQVALPVMADERLHGASALGLLMGVHGAGTLLGMALTGWLGKVRVGTFGTTILLADGVSGLLLLPMGLVDASWQAAAVLVLLGLIGGCMQVAVFSWIQQRVPRAMLGRAMSIFMFIFMGLAPMSAAMTGFLLQYLSLGQLFLGAGLFLVAYSLLAFACTNISRIADPASTA